MKKYEDKELEKFVENAMKKATLESPSFDFTSVVMSKVQSIKMNTATTYQPLITKRFWFVIGLSCLVFMIYVVITVQPETSSFLNGIDFNPMNYNSVIKYVNHFHISKTLLYTIFAISVMLLIQIPLLKHYFNKRLEY